MKYFGNLAYYNLDKGNGIHGSCEGHSSSETSKCNLILHPYCTINSSLNFRVYEQPEYFLELSIFSIQFVTTLLVILKICYINNKFIQLNSMQRCILPRYLHHWKLFVRFTAPQDFNKECQLIVLCFVCKFVWTFLNLILLVCNSANITITLDLKHSKICYFSHLFRNFYQDLIKYYWSNREKTCRAMYVIQKVYNVNILMSNPPLVFLHCWNKFFLCS